MNFVNYFTTLTKPLESNFLSSIHHVRLSADLVQRIRQKTDNMTMYQRAGPKLADITDRDYRRDRLEVLRQADDIMIQEIKTAGLYKEIAQAFAVLLPVSNIGVMGDERTYENVIALRAVETLDYMTADWVRLPHDLLARTPTALFTISA